MRVFHLAILAYSLLAMGCGYKTTPVWHSSPQATPTQQENTGQ